MKILLISYIFLLFVTSGFCQPKVYNIVAYGAKGDSLTDNTRFIQNAIDKANAEGGGIVVVPSGKFISGVIHLKSNVNLHLEADAFLLASIKRLDYGKDTASAFIVAENQHNISLTGKGTIDGRGRELVKDLIQQLEKGLLSDPDWQRKRPKEYNRPQLISFTQCTDIQTKGIKLKDAAAWVTNFEACTKLTIDSLNINSTAYWNNDGLDIVNCKDVSITNCAINSADDGICLKSEGKTGGICENVYVANCSIRSSASAFKLGTGSHGGFKNIKVRNLNIYDTYRSAIALESVDGGTLGDIDIQNVSAKNTGNAIFIRLGHRNKSGEVGSLRNVYIANVLAEIPATKPDSGYETEGPRLKYPHNVFPSSITGIPGHYVENVVLENIDIRYAGGADTLKACFASDTLERVPENEAGYPEFSMFKELPAWGFYVRHVNGLKMKNIQVSTKSYDYRPACVFDDINKLQISNLYIPEVFRLPILIFNRVSNYTSDNLRLPVGDDKAIRTIK